MKTSRLISCLKYDSAELIAALRRMKRDGVKESGLEHYIGQLEACLILIRMETGLLTPVSVLESVWGGIEALVELNDGSLTNRKERGAS
jgi:hypothetical protein